MLYSHMLYLFKFTYIYKYIYISCVYRITLGSNRICQRFVIDISIKKKEGEGAADSSRRNDSRIRLPTPGDFSASGRERRSAPFRIPWTQAC